jgi:hypothetical protein
MRSALRVVPLLVLTAVLAWKLGSTRPLAPIATAEAAPPPVNACGCYRDSAGSCYCGKKAGKCVCPGECEPKGCDEKRAKELDKEIEAEAKHAREAEKKQQAEQAEQAEKKRKAEAPPPDEDNGDDSAAAASGAKDAHATNKDDDDDDDRADKKKGKKKSKAAGKADKGGGKKDKAGSGSEG